MFKNKVGLDLDTVYNYFYPKMIEFDDSDVNTMEILPPCIPKTAIERLIREIASELGEYSFEKEAIEALQQVSEEHIIELFKNAKDCSVNAGRKTITIEDFELVSKIQN